MSVGERAVDVFYETERRGHKEGDGRRESRIERRLTSAFDNGTARAGSKSRDHAAA